MRAREVLFDSTICRLPSSVLAILRRMRQPAVYGLDHFPVRLGEGRRDERELGRVVDDDERSTGFGNRGPMSWSST